MRRMQRCFWSSHSAGMTFPVYAMIPSRTHPQQKSSRFHDCLHQNAKLLDLADRLQKQNETLMLPPPPERIIREAFKFCFRKGSLDRQNPFLDGNVANHTSKDLAFRRLTSELIHSQLPHLATIDGLPFRMGVPLDLFSRRTNNVAIEFSNADVMC